MIIWDSQSLDNILRGFLGEEDPSDPKYKKRARILEAGTELFLRHGYRKASMDEVARNAGVAKGTVYLYFKNKNELMLHAIAQEKRRYLEKIKPIFEPSVSPEDRLRLWLEALFSLGGEMPIVSRLMRGDREIANVLDDIDPTQNEQWADMQTEFVSQMIEQAMPEPKRTAAEIREMAIVLIGLAYFGSILTDDHVRRGLTAKRFAEVLSGMITDGIVASKSARDTSKGQGGVS